MVADPRIGVFEEHIVDWRRDFLRVQGLTDRSSDDVMACAANVSGFPFNMVLAARFEGNAAERTRDVADWYIDRGLSWCWWTTPSSTSPELESVLAEVGMRSPQGVAMHRSLDGYVETVAPPTGVELQVVRPGSAEATDAMMVGWQFPPEWSPYWQAHGDVLGQQDAVALVASIDDSPVSFGIGYRSASGAWGLWVIGTAVDHRGRGIGSYLTDQLLAQGVRRDAREAVLGASESGQPIYARLGFDAVCRTTQWIWTPPSPADAGV